MQLSDRIGRRMKLQDLHVLMTVVQAGSMGKAAERLSTSQPNISRSIADLEHAIGVRLLDRNRRGVAPTEYGRALLDGGAAMFDDLRQAVKKIEFLADPTGGEVRIGSSPPLAASFVSAIIDRLSQRHPRIVFHLVVGEPDALHRELSERNLDLLFIRKHRLFTDETFGYEFLYNAALVVVAGAQNPWVRRRKIELSELVNEPWLLPARESVIGLVMMDIFRASGLDYPRATVVTTPLDVRMCLLATGRFLAIFQASLLRFPIKRPDLKALPVELRTANAPVGIVTLKNRTLSPVAQLFIEHAREVAKSMARGK